LREQWIGQPIGNRQHTTALEQSARRVIKDQKLFLSLARRVPLIGESIPNKFSVCSSKGQALQLTHALDFLSIQPLRGVDGVSIEGEVDDQPYALKPMTLLYNPFKEMAKYTEIARINRLRGTVVLSAFFGAQGWLSGIRVVRGVPDGLTRRAIEALKMVRFSPASLHGAPVSRREFIEFDFNLD